MKKLIIASLFGSFGLFSCQKEGSTPVVPPANYMSFTANSTWNYESTDNIAKDSVAYTLLSTNTDSTINGKVYHVFTKTNNPNQYYNLTGNDYYTFQNLPATTGTKSLETVYLKDNVAVNGTWQQSYTVSASGLPLTINLVNTIAEKNTTLVVNGVTYTDVIHVTTALSANVSGFPIPAGAIVTDIQTYFAKKVGMILSKNKISINYGGNVNDIDQTTYLKSASIK